MSKYKIPFKIVICLYFQTKSPVSSMNPLSQTFLIYPQEKLLKLPITLILMFTSRSRQDAAIELNIASIYVITFKKL